MPYEDELRETSEGISGGGVKRKPLPWEALHFVPRSDGSHSSRMPAGENDARHIAASTAKARGSECYAAGNYGQVRQAFTPKPFTPLIGTPRLVFIIRR